MVYTRDEPRPAAHAPRRRSALSARAHLVVPEREEGSGGVVARGRVGARMLRTKVVYKTP